MKSNKTDKNTQLHTGFNGWRRWVNDTSVSCTHKAAARRGHDIKILTQRIKHTFLLHVLLTLKALCLWLRSRLVFHRFFIWCHHVAASRTTRPALWAAGGVHVTIVMMTELNMYQVIRGHLFQEVQCSWVTEISSLESCSSTLPSYPVWSVFGQSWGLAWAHVKSLHGNMWCFYALYAGLLAANCSQTAHVTPNLHQMRPLSTPPGVVQPFGAGLLESQDQRLKNSHKTAWYDTM